VRGKVEIRLNPSGGYEPVIVKPGRLVLFRTDQTIPGGTGKAGEAYRWDKDLNLTRVGKFDLKKTDEELYKDYGLKGDKR
jgi:hypothetical protein